MVSVGASSDSLNVPVASETVLVVDDDVMVRRLVVRMLTEHGYRVLPAGNADEAIDVLRRAALQIRLVLTDLRMPGLNGRQLGDTVLACWPHIRVLFMSGYPAERLMTEGALVNGRPFIRKPFTSEQLTTRIRELLADLSGQ